MTYIDEQLNALAQQYLRQVMKLSPTLADASHEKRLRLTLETAQGILIDTSSHSEYFERDWKYNLIPILASNQADDEQTCLFFSSERWELLAHFKLETLPFYTTVSILNPPHNEYALRYEVQALLDCFNRKCQKILTDFFADLLSENSQENKQSSHSHDEILIIKNLIHFTPHTECLALLDPDGFVLTAIGNDPQAEQKAHNLALFYYRSLREFSLLDAVEPIRMQFSSNHNAVLVGMIERTNISLAISVFGKNAKELVDLLWIFAESKLSLLAARTAKFWGADLEATRRTVRIRDSWFNPPKLVPLAKYVSCKGLKSFHIPTCITLSRSNEVMLNWFATRSEAIHSGLSPCNTCHP